MNERFLAGLDLELDELIADAEKTKGEWNGDNAGRQEDRANIAEEIQKKARELQELMRELHNV